MLAARGAAIAPIDLTPQSLQSLAQELSGRPLAWAVADVTDAQGLAKTVHDLERRLGVVDLLIASAGIGRETSAMAYSAADAAAVIEVNLIGLSNSIAAVLPGMLARARGHVVAVSSLASFRGVPRLSAYSASKAGVNALMDGLRLELRAKGIALTTVCPGFVRTPMTARIQGLPRMLTVEYTAARILDAVQRKQALSAFPAHIAWPMRLLGVIPSRLGEPLARLMFRGRGRLADATRAECERMVDAQNR